MTDKMDMVAKQKIIDDENERLFGGGQSRPRNKSAVKKVGMSDEEIIASGSGLESSQRVPKWFWSILIVMILIAYGLTVPFWGDRAGSPREWFNWGHVAAFAYIAVFGSFVYFMTMMYGSDDENADDESHGDESGENQSGDSQAAEDVDETK
ncbi:MAG: hypothetical protein Q9M16_06385 [Mariprofundus sp.]|nr:hypothetical protein [Mariprofundus sp.]